MQIHKKIFLVAAIFSIILFSLLLTACNAEKNKENEKSNSTQGEEMKNPVVVMETSKGTIEIELNAKNAPVSTENFLKYVNEGFYDGTVFHRVMAGFMVQGGGFLPNGTQKTTHDPIELESKNGLKNLKGTIAMARTTVPDSATSQFFINTANNSFLDYGVRDEGYAVFGKVISGMDVVSAIEKVNTTTKSRNQNWPVEDVVIIKVYEKKN